MPATPCHSDTDTDSDSAEQYQAVLVSTRRPSLDSDSDDDTPIAQLARQKGLQCPTLGTDSSSPSNPSNTPFPSSIPSFTPLAITPNRFTSKGRPNYYHFRNVQEYTPHYVFLKFIPNSMLKIIADNTNRYANKKSAGTGRRWKDVTWKDVQFFRPCPLHGCLSVSQHRGLLGE